MKKKMLTGILCGLMVFAMCSVFVCATGNNIAEFEKNIDSIKEYTIEIPKANDIGNNDDKIELLEISQEISWDLSEDGTLTISGVGSIPDYDFNAAPWAAQRDNIKRIEIKEGITYIGQSAFYGCTSAEGVTIPDGVTGIADYAFYGCIALKSIVVPDSVTDLGRVVFGYCQSLEFARLPDNIESYGDSCFYCCESLKTVNIPESFTYIHGGMFYSCESLENIVIPDGVTFIYKDAFKYCTALKEISLPDNVTQVWDGAFAWCFSLEKVDMSDLLYSINEEAFIGCESLQNIEFNSNLQSIKGYAFAYCAQLTEVNILESITSIDDTAFYGCMQLEEINVSSKNTQYASENGVLFNKDKTKLIQYPPAKTDEQYIMPSSVTNLGHYSFHDLVNLTSIQISENVEVIVDGAFYGCYALGTVKIPASVNSIEGVPFQYCSALNNVEVDDENGYYSSKNGILFNNENTTLIYYPAGKEETEYFVPRGVIKISDCAFSENYVLEKIYFPEGLLEIGNEAFYFCENLYSIEIPETLRYVGEYAFCACENLSEIKYSGNEEAWNSIDFTEGNDVLQECSIEFNAELTQPEVKIIASGSCGEQLTWTLDEEGLLIISGVGEMIPNENVLESEAWGWDAYNELVKNVIIMEGVTNIAGHAFNNFDNIESLSIPETVVKIEDYAFAFSDSLKNIVIPESVSYIGKAVFSYCESLEKVQLPHEMEYFGQDMFEYCKALKKIVLPENLTCIPKSTFYRCESLADIVLPDNIRYIDALAFAGCYSLENIEIPKTVKYLGDYVFSDCTALKSIIIPDGVTAIPIFALHSCSSLESVIIPNTVVSIGEYAFRECSKLKYITIPKGIENIGQWAFYDCRAIESKIVLDNIKSIGEYAFYDCPVTEVNINCDSIPNRALCQSGLQKLTLGETVKSIGESAFSGCNIYKLVISEGVTSIGKSAFSSNYDLAFVEMTDSVTEIGEGAFRYCNNLSTVKLSKNIKRIENGTFYECWKLKNITIPEGIKYIGEEAFRECTSLDTVYIPGSVEEWGEKSFYEARVHEVIIGDGIKEIPYGTFPDTYLASVRKVYIPKSVTKINGFAFGVHNSNAPMEIEYEGTPDEWAGITIDTYRNSSLLQEGNIKYNCEIDENSNIFNGTYADGTEFKTKFLAYNYKDLTRVSEANANCTSGIFTVEAEGYNNVNVPDCTLNFENTTKIGLVPEADKSYISAVHCSGQDALINDIQISNELKSFDIYAYSNLPEEDIKCFELMQDMEVIQTSQTGKFTVNTATVVLDKPIKVRVVKKGELLNSAITTNIKVSNVTFIKAEDIKLGSSISFTLPSDWPIIGGGKIGIDFSLLPIALEKDGDTIRIGIGADKELLKDGVAWDNFEKFVSDLDKNVTKGKKAWNNGKPIKADCGLEKPDIDVTVYGYLEGSVSDTGEWNQAGGRLVIQVSGKVRKQWQHAVPIGPVVIPVVAKVTGETSYDGQAALIFDFDTAQVYVDGTMEFVFPKITMSVGVGVAYVADLSVYGSLSNVLNVKFGHSANMMESLLEGEVGISAKLLFASYKKALFKGSWKTGHADLMAVDDCQTGSLMSAVNDVGNYEIDRNYDYQNSQWNGSADYVQNKISTDVYYSAAPKLVVTDSGMKMMVWTADIKERNTGNHTAVVYSIYDESAQAWSEPQIIEDDKTADFYPTVTTDGKSIFVAWTDSTRADFDNNTELTQIMNSCEITVAKYSPETNTFDIKKITSDNDYDCLPKIATVGEETYVVWLKYLNSNKLEITGQSDICFARFNGEVWGNESVFNRCASLVSGVAVGDVGGMATISYIIDSDNDVETVNDMELYAGEINGTIQRVTNNEQIEENPQFATINNKSVLVWYSEGNLCYTEDLSVINTLDCSQAGMNSNFAMIDCGDGSQKVFSVQNYEDGTEIYQCDVSGNIAGKPVVISSAGGYITSFSVAKDVNNICIAFTNALTNMENDSIEEKTDLYFVKTNNKTDLKVESISFEQSDVEEGVLPVDLYVQNNGTIKQNSVNITAQQGGKVVLNRNVDIDLPAGEAIIIEELLPLGEVLSENVYTFTVTPGMGEDVNMQDNSFDITIGYTDLNLKIDKLSSGDNSIYSMNIENLSCISTDAVLTLRKNDADGEIVKIYELGEIPAYDIEVFEIDKQTVISFADNTDKLYVEVEAEKKEYYMSDNSEYIYIDGVSVETAGIVNIYGLPEMVTLESDSYDGVIVMALYDRDGRMINVNSYSPQNEINVELPGNIDYSCLKIMWFESFETMKLMCYSYMINRNSVIVESSDTTIDLAKDIIGVSANIVNNKNKEEHAILIMALYDEDERLIKAEKCEIALSPGKNDIKTSIDIKSVSDDITLKLMVWDDLSHMCPMDNPIQYEFSI